MNPKSVVLIACSGARAENDDARASSFVRRVITATVAKSAAFSVALSLTTASALAHPQGALREAATTAEMALSQAPLLQPSGNRVAVVADSDEKVRDDYAVLKLAATHLPNERYRIEGAWAAANGHWVDAARYFRLAARYADKYSQHRLSMLYWHGAGVQSDPVQAYVWADLAAERGYPHFLAVREKMWAALTPAQQAAVPARGDAVYREFGDPVAKRRLSDVLGHAKRRITGSRTGFVGRLEIGVLQKNGLQPDLFQNAAVAGIYRPERIDPERYWAIEDRIWKDAGVTVGDLEATTLHREAPTKRKRDANKP
jgi:uncharacterized protein